MPEERAAVRGSTRLPVPPEGHTISREEFERSQALTSFDQAFRDAAALGVSICCASGNDGVGDGAAPRGLPCVESERACLRRNAIGIHEWQNQQRNRPITAPAMERPAAV